MQQRHPGNKRTSNFRAPHNTTWHPSKSRGNQISRTNASHQTRSDTHKRHHRMRYIPALDGIRALAVIAVILYHLNLPGTQGGLLGVTVFFVLSGYLITRLLIAEFDQSSTIDLIDFWKRRIRRLAPASITVIVVTAALCTLFNHVMLTKMRPDMLPSLFFINNWWQIAQNVSYFDALGDPSPLTHFWSLAIEEQFYLIWPPLLFVLLRIGANHKLVRRITLTLGFVSAGAMFFMYTPTADPTRLYYGTDTRAFSLLLGAWMAFIPETSLTPRGLLRASGLARFLPSSLVNEAENSRMTDEELAAVDGASPSAYQALAGSSNAGQTHHRRNKKEYSWQIDLLGLLGLAGLAFICIFTNGYSSFQYQGGIFLESVLSLMVIAAAVQQYGLLARILSLKPLVWLGQRSYSIYLWHYPLLLLMNPVSDVTETPWWMFVIQIILVVIVAELSYRFIETPFRHGAFGRFVARVQYEGFNFVGVWQRNPVRFISIAALLAIAFGGILFVPSTSALSPEGAAALAEDKTNQTSTQAPSDTATAANNTKTETATDGSTSDANQESNNVFPEGSYDILMVGDSVSLRAVPTFEATFPHGHIDAAKNRQFSEGEATYESYVKQNLAGKIAVFALGTNGLVTDDMIDSLMKDVGDRRIAVFITTRSPQPWVADTNKAITNAKNRYNNVRIIDWYSYSANRNDLFDGDGTHLSSKGAEEYIKLVHDAVAKDLPAHPEDHTNDPVPSTVLAAIDAIQESLSSITISRS